ncbi:MAG: mechanosensitive ion channel [Saprospiraceae bacterium]|nr:mechanosensitive ion channel [Saprospiraceae bacterium]
MFLDTTLLKIFNQEISLGEVLTFGLWAVILYAINHIITKILLPLYFQRQEIDVPSQQKLVNTIRRIILTFLTITLVVSFHLNLVIYETGEGYSFHLSTIILGLIVVQIARLLDWYTSKVLLHKYYSSRETKIDRVITPHNHEERASNTMQYIVYTIAIMILISTFDLNKVLFQIPIKDNSLSIRVSSLFSVVLIFLVARLLSWIVTQLILFSYYRRKEVDPGRRYAINQLVNYFIYVIAVFVTVDNIGIDLTVLWGGLAALAVGIGLGMQDVFRDFVAGIILLSERSVEVNDVVNVNGKVGKIKKIGLRTSVMRGRDDTMLILPNSSLVSNNVMNWTHLDNKVRFCVKVGIAYGSDTDLVKKILLEIATKNPSVLTYPAPFVRFKDFGDSALDFELFFWSEELMGIENVLSDLRYSINTAFMQYQITIPFPQRDIWLKGRE